MYLLLSEAEGERAVCSYIKMQFSVNLVSLTSTSYLLFNLGSKLYWLTLVVYVVYYDIGSLWVLWLSLTIQRHAC